MKRPIEAIEKGYGEDAGYHKVGRNGVTSITEDVKSIEFDADDNITKKLLVYNVYQNDALYCEIEAGRDITVYFQQKK